MALFDSYRAVGLITSGKMTPVRRLGDAKNFFTCPAGRAFYVYDCEKLQISLVSRQVPTAEDITSMVSSGSEITFVASQNHLFVFKRAECMGEVKRKSKESAHDAKIVHLCSFGGGDILLSLDISGKLIVWDCSLLTKIHEVEECDLGSDFRPNFLIHPMTYLNKVLVGGESGLLQLWNFRSGKLIHSFKSFETISIECAENSPAVDVVALGMADGSIILHNLRFDRTLFTLKHAAKSRVTALSFFSDVSGESVALLASATKNGELCIWNLKDRAVLHTTSYAHHGSILALSFVPGEYNLISCGSDNSLKSWFLDPSNYHLRRLKGRDGHSRPPIRIRFHPQGSTIATLSSGTDGRALQLLSGGLDLSLRSFHCALDNHAKELSQKGENAKLPTITCIATSEARENDWYNVVTTHIGEYNARVWRFEKGVLGDGVLNMRTKGYDKKSLGKRKRGGNDSDYLSISTCCTISNCGNFAFVGSASGIISQYNLQSGRFLNSFPKQIWDIENEQSREKQGLIVLKRKKIATPGSVFASTGETRTSQFSLARDDSERHAGMVSGLCLDGLDECLFSVGYDSFLRIWDCESGSLLEKISLGDDNSPATQMERSRDGGLFAVALQNFTVSLFDSLTRRVVRQFKSCHQAKITDLCFSPNSRWLITSSMDTTMRVWDLSTARCVDWMRFPSAVTSMSFCPSNEYLATSHVDCLAICLWANKVHFGSAKPDKVIKKPTDVNLPCFNQGEVDEDEDEEIESRQKIMYFDETENLLARSVKPTGDIHGTVMLSESSTTSSRWYTLLHLELIKERNRPIQPPEKPQQVPFFIPTLSADLDTFVPLKSTEEDASPGSRILPRHSVSAATHWGMASVLSMQLEELVAKATLQTVSNSSANSDTTDFDVDDDADEVERARYFAVKKAAGFKEFIAKINALSASAIDFELRSLSIGAEDEEGARFLQAWLEWILCELQARTNFELVQSILGRMIKLHGEALQQRAELQRVLSQVRAEQKAAWRSLQGMIQKCLCYVESFSQLNGL